MVIAQHQASGELESGLPISLSQFSIEESASAGRTGCCGTGCHSRVGSIFGQVPQGGQVSLPGQGLALLFRQNQGLTLGQRSGVCVFPEEFSEGHCSGYCLFLDQANCVVVLSAFRS